MSDKLHVITVIFAVVAFWAVLAYGYVWNILTLMCEGELMATWELVARVGGIFLAPIGAILGYF